VERFLQNQRKLITLKIRDTTNVSILQPCFYEGLYSPIKHKRVHMHLPSSGNWEVKRGIVKITNIRNTNLAISLPCIVWKKQWCTQLLIGLNLRKHFNSACQYLYVSIKRKLFSVWESKDWTQRTKKSYFFSALPFLHIALRSLTSVHYTCTGAKHEGSMWLKWGQTILHNEKITWIFFLMESWLSLILLE